MPANFKTATGIGKYFSLYSKFHTIHKGVFFHNFLTKCNLCFRVKIQNILPAEMVCVYKCDFGDINFLNTDALRPLGSEFRKIPQLAIPAKMHGKKALHYYILLHFCRIKCWANKISFFHLTGIQPKNNVWNNDDR